MDYNGIDILLATKHQKDLAIRELFQSAFGAKLFVPNDFDTDQFGTFTGEVARVGTAYETVIAKARSAIEQYGYDYAVASEGSFGPHPAMFFRPGNVELMSFIDIKNNNVVVVSEMTTDTNYSHIDINQPNTYEAYLQKIGFGSHGVIVTSPINNKVIAKGVTDYQQLDRIIKAALPIYETIRLETDMRAMMNPTRMKIIHQLALKLVERLKCKCPQCGLPGFGDVSVIGNLPCEECGELTDLYLSKVLTCTQCHYQQQFPRDDAAVTANVRYCPCCNP